MKIFLAILLSLLMLSAASIYSFETKLDKARMLYYDSIEDEDKIDMTIDLFEEIMIEDPSFKGTAKTYIGSLTAMRAAHVFWPNKKMDYANEGIDIMDEGIAISPDNIESLFIQGTTLYYLPFFFGKSDDAENNFKKIIRLLDDNSINIYDREMLMNALDFILEEAELTKSEKQKAKNFKKKYDK